MATGSTSIGASGATAQGLLSRLPEGIRRRVQEEAVRIEVPAGTVLFRPGDACAMYVLLTRGTVRVQLVTSTGHQILLYRVEQGETCVLTTSCLIAHEAYGAEGVAETDVAGLGLTPALFERLLAESNEFRRMVFTDFGRRLADLMVLLNEVAFRRMDARLADWLVQTAAREGTTLRHTHQDVAVELGTAREVVSRQLKEFERDGLLSLARGRIDVLDTRTLRQIGATAERTA
ncbi:MAG: Crp/Fnr family transcriptional regulator [Geminicoccaceae bacterium]